MHKLLGKVEKELEAIAEKGITSSNLETAYKLIDIYKDIKESEYYDQEVQNTMDYNARAHDSHGRFMNRGGSSNYEYNDYDTRSGYNRGDWNAAGRFDGPPLSERAERHMSRIREGMERYESGRSNYRGESSQDRIIDGIDMTMSAICMFVESLIDYAETSSEKEIIRKHIDKMKKL